MGLAIVWTPQAERGLDKVLAYLEEEWTIREVLKLKQNLKKLLDTISEYPQICPESEKYKNVHKGLVDKNNYIIYRVRAEKGQLEIINFRGTKQEPLA